MYAVLRGAAHEAQAKEQAYLLLEAGVRLWGLQQGWRLSRICLVARGLVRVVLLAHIETIGVADGLVPLDARRRTLRQEPMPRLGHQILTPLVLLRASPADGRVQLEELRVAASVAGEHEQRKTSEYSTSRSSTLAPRHLL